MPVWLAGLLLGASEHIHSKMARGVEGSSTAALNQHNPSQVPAGRTGQVAGRLLCRQWNAEHAELAQPRREAVMSIEGRQASGTDLQGDSSCLQCMGNHLGSLKGQESRTWTMPWSGS